MFILILIILYQSTKKIVIEINRVYSWFFVPEIKFTIKTRNKNLNLAADPKKIWRSALKIPENFEFKNKHPGKVLSWNAKV